MATTFDGYPLAQQGRAGEALTSAFTGSFIGALSGVVLITFLAPLVAKFALKFGPPEFFSVYLLTFCSFVGMGKGSRLKSWPPWPWASGWPRWGWTPSPGSCG